MKVSTPPIAWHNRERISTVDFQPEPYPGPTSTEGALRLASGGDDKHVVIWELAVDQVGRLEPSCLCDLSRHQNTVNIVRWSPNGRYLASGDTDSVIILWTFNSQKPSAAPDIFGDQADDAEGTQSSVPRENWSALKTLRGHLQDVVGLEWSPCSNFLASCSTDTTAIVFDVKKAQKVKILSDHKGWVSGVAWDPLNKTLATIASDRCVRHFSTKQFKMVHKVNKCKLVLPVTQEAQQQQQQQQSSPGTAEKNVRLFHDDTFMSFYRRLGFSPDGELLVIPSGVLDVDGDPNVTNCTYVFSRTSFVKPVLYLPLKEHSIAVRFSPVKYELRPIKRVRNLKSGASSERPNEEQPWEKYETVFRLPYRMVFAVITRNEVILYDTQQPIPFAKVSKIHYIGLNDVTWSADGSTLVVASTDGFCSIINFKPGELGIKYKSVEKVETCAGASESKAEHADRDKTAEEETKPSVLGIRIDGDCSKEDPMEVDVEEIASKDLAQENVPRSEAKLILEEPKLKNSAKSLDNMTKPAQQQPAGKRVQLITLTSPNVVNPPVNASIIESSPRTSSGGDQKKRVQLVTLSTSNKRVPSMPKEPPS